MKYKAKDVSDWNVWRFGVKEDSSHLYIGADKVEVVPTTMCQNTGMLCKQVPVYEGDWIAATALGEAKRYLVVRTSSGFEVRGEEGGGYALQPLLNEPTSHIDGNIFD